MLNLAEQLTLLSWDERGRNQIVISTLFNACLAGAALLELVWAGLVDITPEQISLRERRPTGSMTLDVVAMALGVSAPVPPAVWTRASRSPLPHLRVTARQSLIQQGLLLLRPCRKLLFIPASAYMSEATARQACVEQMRAALLGPPPDDVRLQAAGALADLSSLIYRICSAQELPAAKARARELEWALEADAMAEPVRLVMRGVQASKDAEDSSASGM